MVHKTNAWLECNVCLSVCLSARLLRLWNYRTDFYEMLCWMTGVHGVSPPSSVKSPYTPLWCGAWAQGTLFLCTLWHNREVFLISFACLSLMTICDSEGWGLSHPPFVWLWWMSVSLKRNMQLHVILWSSSFASHCVELNHGANNQRSVPIVASH